MSDEEESHGASRLDAPPYGVSPVVPTPPRVLAAAIAAGDLPSDAVFDVHLPPAQRALSPVFFTPLVVARVVARWFEEFGVRTALDVGSGVGKLCVAAALSGPTRWTGVEHRRDLVACAQQLARRFGVEDRVQFHHAVFGVDALPEAEAYYLYNPFGENHYIDAECLDTHVERSAARFDAEVIATRRLLDEAPVGTWLVTLHGFGGAPPEGYVERRALAFATTSLHLFEKVA